MKNKRTRMGLSILAGGLSFVGAANAMDLIVNGSFENPNAGEWKYFQTYNYSQAYFDGKPVPASENPGNIWSWRHASAEGAYYNFVTPTNMADFLQYDLPFANSQTVSLTNAMLASSIDAGVGRYTFSCWLASYGKPNANPEQPFVLLRFFDAAGTQVSTNVIFDRTVNTFAIGFAGGGRNPPADLSGNHEWVKYATTNAVPANARKATVYITRSPNAGVSGTPDTYVDLLKLNVIDTTAKTTFDSSVPANGQVGVSPDTVVSATLLDVTTQVNTNTIQFSFDGAQVTPAIQKSGGTTTITYDPPGLLAPLSAHTCRLVWSDNGTPVTTKTNQFGFAVEPYANVNLGPPIYLQNFDGIAPGTLPAGWSVQNFTDFDIIPGQDLDNFHSDTFLDWAVIGYNNLTNWLTVTPGGADFFGAVNVAPNQVINGAVVTNLISTNFIIAVSDRANNTKQIDYLYTGDYNLSGRANVYLSFHNIYVQNQNNIASVEYSIDGGGTWLPALYMLDPYRILRDDTGNIDARNTFAYAWWDVPNVDLNALTGGHFGQYIGVNSNLWSTLAPYISPRGNDDQVGSKRVEVIRLAQADNQATVRFRMALAGVYGWYFGIDDFGLYSVSSVSPPLLTSGPTPAPQTVTAGNNVYFNVAEPYGVTPFAYQWQHNGVNLSGKTGQNLLVSNAGAADAGNYTVVVSNPGGSVTSVVAVLTVLDQRPIFVTGQWDFQAGNLGASYGMDLQYGDSTVQSDTVFGTTTSFGIPDIGGVPTPVMHFVPSTACVTNWGGYKMFHGAAPNGGGSYVNQYTLVYDIYYPTTLPPAGSYCRWRSLLQTDVNNSNDGDMFISDWNGLGISSMYDGYVSDGWWHRVAVAIDLSGPGEAPVLSKFIDGYKVVHNFDGTRIGNQSDGLSGVDGRFSLDPYALLFADEDGNVAEAYVSSIQFSDGRRPDAYLQALGGPNPLKIPGIIKAELVNGQVVIRWSGGVALQSADLPSGPWTTVAGTAGQSTHTPSPMAQAKFYRPQIP